MRVAWHTADKKLSPPRLDNQFKKREGKYPWHYSEWLRQRGTKRREHRGTERQEVEVEAPM